MSVAHANDPFWGVAQYRAMPNIGSPPLSVQLGNEVTMWPLPNQVKYLGLVMDTNLSSQVTVMSLVKQAHTRLKFMYRHRNSLGKMSRQLLSSALIQPHFDYAATSWYMGSTEHLKNKLQVTQNKVVRFILNKPPRQHIGQHELDMVNLLNTEHRVKQLMMTHMYNIYNNNAPSYLCQRFIRIQDQHQHHTRLSEYCFVTPTV